MAFKFEVRIGSEVRTYTAYGEDVAEAWNKLHNYLKNVFPRKAELVRTFVVN